MPRTRDEMAARAALELEDGSYVNLGIGLPTLIPNHVPERVHVVLHSENGILGMGPVAQRESADPWIVNAGKQNVSLVRGASLFHHADSFAMIRGGHIDLCVLGAFEIAANGDLANWTTSSDDRSPAVGGAMDLATGARNVWVMTQHVTKSGEPKLVRECRYPLTAKKAVGRVYSDLAVIDITPKGFAVRAMAPGMTPQLLEDLTGAPLQFP